MLAGIGVLIVALGVLLLLRRRHLNKKPVFAGDAATTTGAETPLVTDAAPTETPADDATAPTEPPAAEVPPTEPAATETPAAQVPATEEPPAPPDSPQQ